MNPPTPPTTHELEARIARRRTQAQTLAVNALAFTLPLSADESEQLAQYAEVLEDLVVLLDLHDRLMRAAESAAEAVLEVRP